MTIEKNTTRVNPRFYFLFSVFQIIASITLIWCTFEFYRYNHSGITNLILVMLIVGSYVAVISIFTLYCGIIGLYRVVNKIPIDTIKRFKIENKMMNSTILSIFHLFLGFFLIFLFLFMTVFNYYQPVSLFGTVITFLAITLMSYSLLLIVPSIIFLKKKILYRKKKKGEGPKILPGLTVISLIGLLIMPVYFVAFIINDPPFSTGLKKRVDLFVGGQDGYAVYRIPSLLIIPEGSRLKNGDSIEKDIILAFAEGRKYNALDTGTIDIVMKRSMNGGYSWSDMSTLITWGNDLDSMKYGNQMVVFDSITGVVFLIFLKQSTESRLGTYIVESDDGGATWSLPVQLNVNFPSSGHGIQLKYGNYAGRLIFTSYSGSSGNSSSVIYSDNHGKTWKDGVDVGDGDECEVVETISGRLYITMRNNAPLGTLTQDHRLYSWSSNGGTSWTKAEEEDLPTPICLASICRLTDNREFTRNRILFCNPTDYVSRCRMTIKMSYDECKSWTVEKLLYKGPSGYSQIAVHSNQRISCLFECGRIEYSEKIVYCEFDLNWLTDGKDSIIERI